MKVITAILFILVCFFTCKSNESDNSSLISAIDKIKAVDTTFEILVDSNDRIIDTLSMRRHKTGSKGNKLFNEITSYQNGSVVKSYYRDNGDLLYTRTEIPGGIFYMHETWQKNGKIEEAINVQYYPKENADTIKMKFKYDLGVDAKLKKLSIFESGGSIISEIFYNPYEKPFLEYHFFDGDTLKEIKYEYKGEKIKSERTYDIKKQTRINRYFGEDEFITAIEVFVNDSLENKKVFRKDSEGNIISKIVK